MIAVLQRVNRAAVSVEGAVVGEIGQGLLILLGVAKGDTEEDAARLAAKIAACRIFHDGEGKMNRSVRDIGGGALVISNFTLLADYHHGNRPSYFDAAAPEEANRLYLYFTEPPLEGMCMLPGPIAAVLSAMAVYMPHIPVFNLFFSNGAAIWLYMFLFGLCIAKKKYSQLILFVPVLAVWLTLLVATPLDNEFRYVYNVFATLPLMCVVPFSHVNCNKAKEPV